MQKASIASKIAAHPKSLLLLACVLIFFTYPKSSADSGKDGIQGDCPKVGTRYGIMMDAGSTGSRTHVFEFKYHPDGKKELVREVFEQLKPGLSAYPTDPAQAAASLIPLMDVAVKEVPKEYQRCTPVAIKGSAGLRLIGKEKSSAILTAVDTMFRKYPFHVGKDAAVLMDGKDEGPYAWLTINFLLGYLDGGKTQTSAIFDLGGGSTQVVFIPDDISTLNKAPKENVLEVTFADHKYKLYTQSYLGLGLKEAGKSMRKLDTDKVCENEDKDKQTQNWSKCHELAEKILKKDEGCSYDTCAMRGAFQPPLLPSFKGDIYVFSYFYDRIETWLASSGKSTVGQFGEVGAGICANDEKYSEHNKGTMCMDLAFEHALLNVGYSLPTDRQLLVKKKINDVETAWPLGAMLLAM